MYYVPQDNLIFAQIYYCFRTQEGNHGSASETLFVTKWLSADEQFDEHMVIKCLSRHFQNNLFET